jgi:hypothetical protein
VSPLFQLLFDPGTDPLVREWITLNIHATIIRHNVDPKEQTESNLTAYTALLLLDGSRYTRAAAVSILTSLMTPNYPAFNAALMRIATRVVTDGSALVRRALVHCLAKYVKVRGRSSPIERPFEYFLRNPVEQPSQDPNTSQIIHLLRNDPSPDVRHAAQEIELGHEVDDWDSKYIHLLATVQLYPGRRSALTACSLRSNMRRGGIGCLNGFCLNLGFSAGYLPSDSWNPARKSEVRRSDSIG